MTGSPEKGGCGKRNSSGLWGGSIPTRGQGSSAPLEVPLARREETILGLSPTCLRLAVVRGNEVTRLERVMLEPSQWETSWSKELRPLDEHVVALARKLEIPRGARVSVLYHAPTTVCELVSVAASPLAATQAAQLSLRESLGGDHAEWLCACRVLHTDPPGSSDIPMTHVLAVAERRDTAEFVAAFAQRAGFQVKRQVPAKGALVSTAAREIVENAAGGKMTSILMSDQVTMISSARNGALIFSRCVDFGYSQLADAIIRGSISKNAENGISREAAYAMLFGVGIPKRGQLIDSNLGLKAESVLPVMQSVLQRYVVETRQTLRFMLAEGELARTSIHLSGPGAMIPGIAGVLTGQLDLPVERLNAGPEPESPTVGTEDPRGDLALLESANDDFITIEPPSTSVRRERSRLSMAMKAGVAVAACLVGGDAYMNLLAAAKLKALESDLSPRVEVLAARHERIAEANRLASTASTAESLVLGTIGDRPDWLASLNMLTRVAGDSIQLVDVAGSYPPESDRQPVLILKGVATVLSGKAASDAQTDALAQFIDRLSKNPIVRSADLISTRADQSDDIKSFVIAVRLNAVAAAVPQENSQPVEASMAVGGSQ